MSSPQVALGWMGVFVLRRAAWWGVLFAAAMAVALPRLWEVVGKIGGLPFDPRINAAMGYIGFQPTLANTSQLAGVLGEGTAAIAHRSVALPAHRWSRRWVLLPTPVVWPRRDHRCETSSAAVVRCGANSRARCRCGCQSNPCYPPPTRFIYWVYPALYLAAAGGYLVSRPEGWRGGNAVAVAGRGRETNCRELGDLDCTGCSSCTRPLSACCQSC